MRRMSYNPLPLIALLAFAGIIGFHLHRAARTVNAQPRPSADRTYLLQRSTPHTPGIQPVLRRTGSAQHTKGPRNRPLALPSPPPAAARSAASHDALEARSDILWKLGDLNGKPADGFESHLVGEYGSVSHPGKVHTIRSKDDSIQFIQPGQTLIIHLGKLDPCEAMFCLAVGSSRPVKESDAMPCDFVNRRLKIWFNDSLVWWRWLPRGHTTVQTYVSTEWIDHGENIITITNEGSEVLCFDAAWLATLQPGPTLFAALSASCNLDREAASQVPVCHLKLPPPPGLTEPAQSQISTLLRGLPQRSVPTHAIDAVKKWNSLKERVAGRPLFSLYEGEVETTWRTSLTRALQRTMLPVVQTEAVGSTATWQLWAQRFGPLVGHWILAGSWPDIERVSQALRSRLPEARITWLPDSSTRTPSSAMPMLSAHPVGYWGARMDVLPGKRRLEKWLQGDLAAEPFDDWLELQDPYFWCDVRTQRKHAAMFPETIIRWWMAGGNKVIVPGGGKGESFFPGATAEPAVSWNSIALLLEMGDGTARRITGNLTPQREKRALADTSWVAASHGTQAVSMAVFASTFDVGQPVVVTLPVPWTGRTYCTIESIDVGNTDNNPKDLAPQRMDILATGFQVSRRLATARVPSSSGMVSFPVTLAPLQRIRLMPHSGAWPRCKLFLPPSTPPPEPTRVRRLFVVDKNPIPSHLQILPLRSPQGLADPLSMSCSHSAKDAVPGTLPAWEFPSPTPRHRRTVVRNVSPWNRLSDRVLLSPVDSTNATPTAVRLYWSTGAMTDEAVGTFWLRCSSDTILLGTQEKRERLLVEPDTWQRVSFSIRNIRNQDHSLPRCLTLWHDARGPRRQEIELNGFSLLEANNADASPASVIHGHATFLPRKEGILIALAGEPGKPGHWYCRFADPVSIKQVAPRYLTPDGVTPTKLTCSVTYRQAAQVLQLNIDSFPDPAQNPDLEMVRAFIPGAIGLTNSKLSSLVLLHCTLDW